LPICDDSGPKADSIGAFLTWYHRIYQAGQLHPHQRWLLHASRLLPERRVALCVSATRRLHKLVDDVVEVLQNRKAWQAGGGAFNGVNQSPLLLNEQGLAVGCSATTARSVNMHCRVAQSQQHNSTG
jgi:hypothetical protein